MIPQFANKESLFEYLKLNKDLLIRQKKAQLKHADAVLNLMPSAEEVSVNKGENDTSATDPTSLVVKAVINTTNIMDSHDDVHFKGIWKKSLNESKQFYHLQEHEMRFDKVISDEVKAYTEDISWKQLGYNYDGTTQALVFESKVSANDNSFMFDQYKRNRVKNHSVGMQYVKIQLAVNSTDKYFKEEKDAWDKYYEQIVNKELAEEKGYFFAVTEAKVIEGSAVLVGSNRATPTMSVTYQSTDVSEAEKEFAAPDTSVTITDEPHVSTPSVDWKYIFNHLNTSK